MIWGKMCRLLWGKLCQWHQLTVMEFTLQILFLEQIQLQNAENSFPTFKYSEYKILFLDS